MEFALSETQEITRKSVRDFAEQDIIPQSHAFDESQEFPYGWAKKMGELGLFGVYVPEKYGGGGVGLGWFGGQKEVGSRGVGGAWGDEGGGDGCVWGLPPRCGVGG